MEVRQAEFARMAGVSRATISEKVKIKTLVCNSAGMLDTDNATNRAYLDKRQREFQNHMNTTGPSFTGPQSNTPSNLSFSQPLQGASGYVPQISTGSCTEVSKITGLPEELLGLTIRELVMRYGSVANLEKYVRMLKDLTTADEKDQKIRERRLALVEKDFVISRVFAYLDVLMNQLLDYPESSTDLLIAKALSGHENARGEIVATLRDGLTRIIAGAKETIVKEINGLRLKYQNSDPLAEIREQIEEAGQGGFQ
jgi:hypothetical protein